MIDTRYTKLATLLLGYSIKLKKNEKVWIRAIGLPAVDACREIYKQAISLGAHAYMDISDSQIHPYFLSYAADGQLSKDSHVEEYLANWADKIVTVVGEENTRALSNTDPHKLVLYQKYKKHVRSIILKKPWVLTYVPTQALAQEASMDVDEWSTFYFNSVLRNWEKESDRMKNLATRLTNAQKIEVKGVDTDLVLSAKGRIFIPDCGECNMPGGEIFTAPVETSVEGSIYFNFPLLRTGKTIRDIRLWFEKGKIVKSTASENEEYLHQIIETDHGSHFLGEFAIGMNPGITRYVNNMLFDEKIEGTIHMAIGQAYDECKGVNTSAVHMDIVKDMHEKGSQVIVDGVPILVDGVLQLS